MLSGLKFVATYVIPVFELIPVLIGLLNYKYLTRPVKSVFYLAILTEIMDSLNTVMSIIFHQLSKPYVDTMAILDFPIFSAFYIMILGKNWKTPVIILLALYYLLWIADYWFIEASSPMNVYPLALKSVLIMLYAIVYMNQQTQKNIEEQWSANPVNWINSGYLIYFASSVMLILFYDFMLKINLNITVFSILWQISNLACVTQLILISIGIYKCRQYQTISL